MDIINNRYRVIRSKKNNYLISSYIVYDMLADFEVLELNILNCEYISESFLDMFVKEFISYAGISSSNLIKDYEFDLVDIIDNKKLSDKKFYYTCKHYESCTDFLEFAHKADEKAQIDAYMQVLRAVNFLHLKGFAYGVLNPDNIFIYNENGENIAKLKDIASAKLQNTDYWGINSKYINYLSPETLSGRIQSIYSDIYSLGVLLLQICIGEDISGTKRSMEDILNENSYDISSKRPKDLFYKLRPVISKMINTVSEDRYDNIRKIIDDINSMLNSNYEAHKIEELQKLTFDTKICGREYEINKVIGAYELLKNHEPDGRVVLIHGESGIGKTRFLEELRHILRTKKANLYYSFSLESSTKNGRAIVEILKKMIAESDAGLVKKYESELAAFIPEILNSKTDIVNEMIFSEKGKFKILNGIFSYINEFASNNPIVFIIDNINFADDYSIELLEFIYSRYSKNTNIMFIGSYCDTELSANVKLSEIINKFRGNNDIMDITLRELSIQDTAEMVKCILSSRNVYRSFSSRIYSLTYGNPLFIQEVIKNLFLKKIIFIDQKEGVWDSNYNEDYNELPLPSSMEQAVLNQIKEIDYAYYSILNTISIFNTGVSLEIITEFISGSIGEVEKNITDLIGRGLVCKKIEDWGFVYDFYNKVLKTIIYNRLSNEEKELMHKKAAEVLEKHYLEKKEDNEEIIFHLEKSGNREKVIKYCIENADALRSKRNRKDAVKNLQKAISMFHGESLDIRKIEILIKIGDIYNEEGNLTQSIDLYDQAESIAEKANEKSLMIDCLNKISEVYYDKNNLKAAEKYSKKVEVILKDYKYLKGYLACMLTYSRILSKKQEYKKAYEIIKTTLDVCPEEFSEIKGSLYHILGNVYIQTARIEEALHSYEECIKCFEKTNYVRGVINGLNNIGVIYADFNQDVRKALEYFLKSKELSERNSFISLQAHNLVNIAEMYHDLWDYELSYKYFKEALELSIQVEYESNVFYCYNYLSNLSLNLKNYAKAYEYYYFAKKELENYPEHGKEMGVHYQISSELFLELGKIEKAKEYITKAIEIYNNDDSKTEWECKIINEYINIIDKNYEDIYTNILNVKDYIKNYSDKIKKIDTLFTLCVLLLDGGSIHLAADIYRYAEKLDDGELPGVINLKKHYIMGILEHGEGKMKALSDALDISKIYNNPVIKWKIFCTIGDLYFSKRNYFESVNYYFEACEIIRNLVQQIPDEFKLQFINFNHMLRPYNKLIEFKIRSEHTGDLTKKELRVKNLKDLYSIIEYQDLTDILENKLFIKSAKNIYKNRLPENVRNIKDIVANLGSNAVENLELLAKYISIITLASNVMILLDEADKGYCCIASSSGKADLPDNKYIIDMVKALKEPEIISDPKFDKKNKDLNYSSGNIKSSMCIPVIAKDKLQKDEYIKDRRKKGIDTLSIKGYIYLESDRILNNLNEESMGKCLELTGLIGLLIDKYQLKISSTIDKLTGTVTRKALEDTITGLIDNNSKSGGSFSILMFDLDHFKNINDRFGHQMGDTALKRVCEIAMQNIRFEDTCGRYGGEEFIIALPDVETNEAYLIAEKIRMKIDEDKILDDKLPVTISIGIASFPEHGQWQHELIEKADQALYVAKELGRNRSQIWNSEFSNYKKSTNKLSGIITGNVVQDSRNVLVIAELIELIKSEISVENKIFNALGRIIEITEAQNGIFFRVEDNNIVEKYGRKIFVEEWAEVKNFNIDIINSVILKKQGLYMIDWDEIAGYDSITGIPDWHSIIVVPVIRSGIVKGIMYLTVSTKLKEFKFDDFNFVETLSEIIAAML